MADSLFFDGIDDFINFSAGDFAGNVVDSITLAVAVKLVADEAAYKNFMGYNALDAIFGTTNTSPHLLTYFPGAGASATSTFTIPASDGWCIYAFNRVGDNGRMHKYVFDTDTWTHEDNAAFPNDPAEACTTVRIGCAGNGTQFMDANFLIAAVWDSNLSNATIETLAGGTQAWIDAAPDECWRFDTLSAISSLTGTSTESSRTGTSLDAGEAPTGWLDIGGAAGFKRLYGPAQLTGTAATLYTAPASTLTRLLHVHASNPSGSPVDVNLSIGADAAATRVWDDLAVGAESTKDDFTDYTLAAGETIQGWADSAATVTLTISGFEEAA